MTIIETQTFFFMLIPIPFASLKTQNGMKSVSLERFFCILKLQGYQYTTNHAEVSGPPLVQGDRMFICVDCLSKHK